VSSRLPPQRVPTLTEVIEIPPPVEAPIAPDEAAVSPAEANVLPVEASAAATWPTEDELRSRVLADVLRQVEVMLEHRLREALMPALIQASETMVLQARTELATALNDVVSRAVTQEMARLRPPRL